MVRRKRKANLANWGEAVKLLCYVPGEMGKNTHFLINTF